MRNNGVFDFSANFEVKIVAPLDARMKVSTKADLFNQQMLDSYPYAGMIAAVTDDSTEANNGIYHLTKMPCVEANWQKIGSANAFTSAKYENGKLILTKGDGTVQELTIYTSGLLTDKTIVDMTLSGTILTLLYNDGTTLTEDLNTIQLSGVQYQKGITTHDYLKLTAPSFEAITFNLAFPGADLSTIFHKRFFFTDLKAKETTIVVDLNTANVGYHHIIQLPHISETEAPASLGKRIKLFVKRNTITDKTKRIMVATQWHSSGVTNRILGVSAATAVANQGYFMPLEWMEVVELLWDGEDWIALSRNKEEYVTMDAKDYTFPVTEYITTR